MRQYLFRPLFFIFNSVFAVLIYSVLLLYFSIESLFGKVNIVLHQLVFDLLFLVFCFLLPLRLHKELLDSSKLMRTFDIFPLNCFYSFELEIWGADLCS